MPAAYVALALQTVIAALTFLVAKDAGDRFGPGPLVWFRIVISGLLVGTVHAVTHRRHPRPPARDVLRLALLGLLGVILNQGFFLYGLHRTEPLHAALLYAFTPVLVLAMAALWFGERPTPYRLLGVGAAVAGVTLVLTARGLDLSRGPFQGDLLILVGVLGWSAYTVLGKPLLSRYDTFTVVTGTFVTSAAFLLPVGPAVLRGFDPASPGARGWLEMLYLAAFTSGVAFTLWYYAVKRLDATRAAVFTNLQAPLTALLAWWVLGSVPSAQVVAGGCLVLLGVTVVQIRPRR